jgi:hypothetical protein
MHVGKGKGKGKGRERKGKRKRKGKGKGEDSVAALRAADDRGTRLPEDWQPSEQDIAYAKQQGMSDEGVNGIRIHD